MNEIEEVLNQNGVPKSKLFVTANNITEILNKNSDYKVINSIDERIEEIKIETVKLNVIISEAQAKLSIITDEVKNLEIAKETYQKYEKSFGKKINDPVDQFQDWKSSDFKPFETPLDDFSNKLGQILFEGEFNGKKVKLLQVKIGKKILLPTGNGYRITTKKAKQQRFSKPELENLILNKFINSES